jgi:hypothetical protein
VQHGDHGDQKAQWRQDDQSVTQPIHVVADLYRRPECRAAECHARQPQAEKHWPVPGRVGVFGGEAVAASKGFWYGDSPLAVVGTVWVVGHDRAFGNGVDVCVSAVFA